MIKPGIEMSAFFQYERWAFPLLAGAPKTNATASLQITYTPTWGAH
ncbi:MAG: hypothetical protein JF563_04475 [Acidobacteriales bacterium]|nr:hypothetical protein [Terriglobales bacterium]